MTTTSSDVPTTRNAIEEANPSLRAWAATTSAGPTLML